MPKPSNLKVFSDQQANGNSIVVETFGHYVVAGFIAAIGGSVGATVKLQGSADGINWADLKSITVNTAGNSFIVPEVSSFQAMVYMPYLRLNISSYTAGTFNCWISGSGFAGIV